MKFGKCSAIAVMTIAAVGGTAGTANAQPAAIEQAVTTSGVEQGIGYNTALSTDDKVVTTTLDAGKFVLSANGNAVNVQADSGAVIAEVPLTFEVAGHAIPVGYQIADSGRRLSLTPEVSPKDIAELKNINSFDNFVQQANQNILGMILGGVLGGYVGGLVGFGIFSVITGTIGLVAGALAGGAVMGGQPFVDALTALATGQP
ncbi:hypothetical protein ACQP1G_03645 [Nocardia sp. CA-107356]|uniref:hypothetical protein n=1 Tax=Nocardia sp. CA-107356 TaxID=3239972 RepID=UPI003D943F63